MQRAAHKVLTEAAEMVAGDIYFLPRHGEYLICFDCQGLHYEYRRVSHTEGQKMINYLKFNSDMSLTEKRRPQLGAWQFKHADQTIHCRLSAVGDYRDRESLVIRLLYPHAQLKQGYFFADQWQRISQACQQRGLVLFAGPMGSGKTTAMYHFARQLTGKMVLCIEDPIEIQEERFLQIQVNDRADMTYEQLLRVALRHHPDVFIIGEIRDTGTAQIAVRAALSGHLVLSTVHARNVYGVYQRLVNLGVDEQELGQVLNLISYQRLLPTIQGDQRVLFDQVVGWDQEALRRPQAGMTTEWRENLARCQQAGWITPQTVATFQEG